eukprot:TRINITY_DN1216_c0_g1_i3.p1 TRINITY_DN1216_c0_g1~~TRINITY_DN1216_c0_g1_i3.p1  ORF type:complete len:1244 (-),score=342.48 TRINITY_DN1216_c0_g1_i3:2933-6664(-)
MFEKSLTDLVRGIRNNKKNEAKYISQAIQEIKEELKSIDMDKKAVAIQKLTYLQMLGYDMSWAAFNVVEVMSQTKFTAKRIGYLAACQSFHESTDVVVLATSLIRKDFTSANQYEAGISINCLANICTPDLARDLASDLVSIMNSSKPYIRKKAALVMYKVFLKFPDSLRPSFPKLKDKLEDSDPAVISSAVNVICELARKNPKNYLSLAPTLFKLLTSNYNNWMLIKIIKLFGALTPLEPRLAKKLIDPLSNIINTTPAMSLLYECIQTCTVGMSEQLPIIKLCITKLRNFVEDSDPNLKYLGLLALLNIMKIHPKAVAEHRDLVIGCLDDEDVTIRLRALDLLTGMVSKRNLPDIIKKLLEHLEKAEGSYRDELVEKIVSLCSQNAYAHVTDFEWYLTVLVQLTHVHGTSHGSLLAAQLLDVIVRVTIVRRFGVQQMVGLLREARLLSNPVAGGVCEVLYAAAWTVGEFARYLEAPAEVIESLLQPRAVALPSHIQSVYMQNVLKVFSYVVAAAHDVMPEVEREEEEEEDEEEEANVSMETVDEADELMNTRLPLFTHSPHLEVQERACFTLEMLKVYHNVKDNVLAATDDETADGASQIASELASLFFEEQLNPVAPRAQKKVPIPEGLDLNTPINEPEAEEEETFFDDGDDEEVSNKKVSKIYEDESEEEEEEVFKVKESPEERERQKRARMERQANNPYMLQSRSPRATAIDDFNIPVVTLPQNLGPVVVGKEDSLQVPSPTARGGRNKKKPHKAIRIQKDEEMPEGAVASDQEDDAKSTGDALSNINLDEPLGAHEALPVSRHRTDIQREKAAAAAAEQQKLEERERRRKRREGKEGKEGSERPSREKREGKEGRSRRPPQEGLLVDLGLENTPLAGLTASSYENVGSPAAVPLTLGEPEPEKKRRSRREGEEGDHRPRREGEERERRSRREGEEGERKSRREGEEGERRSRREGEEGERRSRKEGERSERKKREEGGERSSRSRHEGERREKRERREAEPTEAASASRRPKPKPLLESTDLNVRYDVTASTTEKGKVNILFFAENKSDTDLSSVEIFFTDSMSVRVAKNGSGSNCNIGTLQAGQRAKAEATATVSNVSTGQRLKGFITYNYLGEGRRVETALNLSCSTFVIVQEINKEQFANILTGETGLTLVLNSTRVRSSSDFLTTVNTIVNALHVHPVQVGPTGASAYGKSILGHHVALLIKDRGENNTSVDIKSSDSSLGSSLIQEITALFK